MTYEYKAILHWNNALQAFIAGVPELIGCIAHGDTGSRVGECQRGNRIVDHDTQEFGDPIPEPMNQRLVPA